MPKDPRSAELERLKSATASRYYCGICGTRDRTRHRVQFHQRTDPKCGGCGTVVRGTFAWMARCSKCDPRGVSRKAKAGAEACTGHGGTCWRPATQLEPAPRCELHPWGG